MHSPQNIVAIDLGNSSGRVVLGQWEGGRGVLREIYRFPNEPDEEAGHVVWNIERIWHEILKGLRIAAVESGGRVESIGLDCWGAEYVLVDNAGDRIGPAYTLRDPRQVRAMERAFPSCRARGFMRLPASRCCPSALSTVFLPIRKSRRKSGRGPRCGWALRILPVSDDGGRGG